MIKGIVNGSEKDISRIVMFANGVEKNGWEVRDSQDRLIWGRQETISGSTPLNFTSGNGNVIASWSMLGNVQQSGTPTPDNPIMPDFCGKLIGTNWTIPITCGGQTVPVYLGEVPTVRMIKKLVLTGEENWNKSNISSGSRAFFAIAMGNTPIENALICTHFEAKPIYTTNDNIGVTVISNGGVRIRTSDSETRSVSDFKSFLSDKYAAGTPVTIWYVLATPETDIVNEPLCKIRDYVDELRSADATDAGVTIPTTRGQNVLTVGTDLQPSSITISGHIK